MVSGGKRKRPQVVGSCRCTEKCRLGKGERRCLGDFEKPTDSYFSRARSEYDGSHAGVCSSPRGGGFPPGVLTDREARQRVTGSRPGTQAAERTVLRRGGRGRFPDSSRVRGGGCRGLHGHLRRCHLASRGPRVPVPRDSSIRESPQDPPPVPRRRRRRAETRPSLEIPFPFG